MIVVGPIAHSVEDLRFFLQAVLSAEPWFADPKVLELPWRVEHVDRVKGRPLTIGIIYWDTLVKPHPPVQRGMKMVEKALKDAGHDVFEWFVPDAKEHDHLSVCPYCNPINLDPHLLRGRREGYS
jgi:amidase